MDEQNELKEIQAILFLVKKLEYPTKLQICKELSMIFGIIFGIIVTNQS